LKSARFDQAKLAYDAGDYVQALRGFYATLKEDSGSFEPGDAGLVYYRLGNCLLKMRSFTEAASTYGKALEDAAFQNKGPVYVNCGKAQLGLGLYEDAIANFKNALGEPRYTKPYQAQLGLGNAYSKLGMIVDAGTAYRNAALDENNPSPVKALTNLGACFTALGRPQDAIETYLAILDFKTKGSVLNKTFESLGQSYVALDRYREAIEAFQDAMRDGSYTLSADAQDDYHKAVSCLGQPSVSRGYEGQGGGARADSGYDTYVETASYEPYPEYQESMAPNSSYGAGNVPLAQDTGFFTATDADLIAMGKSRLRKERKARHTGLKVVLVIVVLLVIALGAAVFAYTQGYGYPMQEAVIEDLFATHAQGGDTRSLWVDSDTDDSATIARIMEMVATTSTVTVDYLSRSMSDSEALVAAKLQNGGTVYYHVTMSRDKLSWKVNGIEMVFASQQKD
jgi:tetratricopeptide (TPR) repeat protein